MNDHDEINVNDKGHDYKELWEAMRKEETAKAEQLDAEQRMERAGVLEEMGKQFDATTDWTAAKWDEFTAKMSQWGNKAEIDTDEAI